MNSYVKLRLGDAPNIISKAVELPRVPIAGDIIEYRAGRYIVSHVVFHISAIEGDSVHGPPTVVAYP